MHYIPSFSSLPSSWRLAALPGGWLPSLPGGRRLWDRCQEAEGYSLPSSSLFLWDQYSYSLPSSSWRLAALPYHGINNEKPIQYFPSSSSPIMGSLEAIGSLTRQKAARRQQACLYLPFLPPGCQLASKRAYAFPILKSWHVSCNARAIYLYIYIDTTLIPW